MNRKLTTEEFVSRAHAVHGNKYDYSKVEYKRTDVKIEIVCPEHGSFLQTPKDHLSGRGCPGCGRKRTTEANRKSTSQFINKAVNVHGNKYDYSKVEYNGVFEKVCIVCPKHGEFWQHPHNHTVGHGCPKCANVSSKPELEIMEMLDDGKVKMIQSYRGWYGDNKLLEIDIFIPELNIGIEYNGNRWHSSQFHPDPKWHQQEKVLLAAEAGIRLITVPEWAWLEKRHVVESILSNHLGSISEKVYARKCNIIEVPSSLAREFHEVNHIHGFAGAGYHIALEDDFEVVAVLSVSEKKGKWEITRYSTSKKVVGGFSKLFKYFVSKHNPLEVISYADARFWTGCSYRSAGFVLDGITDPGYVYVDADGNVVGSRQQFQKHKLKRLFGKNFDPSLTEEENCARNGLYRLYDCGHWRWVWKNT